MSLQEFQLLAVSPIDGRYGPKTTQLREVFSEYGLIRSRVSVEIQWLKKVVSTPEIGIPAVGCVDFMDSIVENFSVSDALRVKELEAVTNHDVKAVEYLIKEKLSSHPVGKSLLEYVHFTCTSEDINNLSYGLMIKESVFGILVPTMESVLKALSSLSQATASVPLLSLTHGQAATPSTFGRELAVFVYRLEQQLSILKNIRILGKFNGATGSFNAHLVAYPNIDWETLASDFVEKDLGLTYQPVSTQIEPHDYISEMSDVLSRISNISIGFSRDMWTYISRGVLKLRAVSGEVGSSTMPHKVNPIDFENAEGNLGICVALFNHFSDKLVISRLQRDLSDSTVLRNIGVAFGHFLIAFDSLRKGLRKVDVNLELCATELNSNWSLLAEPVQTVMRKAGIEKPYEKLKAFTRGAEVDQQRMHEFIKSLEGSISENDFRTLSQLTPGTYVGLAESMARKYGVFE